MAATVIFPLSTTFSPNPTCTDTLSARIIQSPTSSIYDLWVGNKPGTFDYATDCYPSGLASVGFTGTVANYYSPAVCPLSWTQVTSTVASSADAIFQSGETAAFCCPISYKGGYGIDIKPTDPGYTVWKQILFCSSSVQKGRTVVAYRTSGGSDTDFISLKTPVTLTVDDSTHSALAPAIQIRWRSSDSFKSALISTQESSTTSSISGGNSSLGTDNHGANHGGIPKSGIIAIAAIAPIIILGLIIILVVLFLRRRRRRQRPTLNADIEIDNSFSDLPEVMTADNMSTLPLVAHANRNDAKHQMAGGTTSLVEIDSNSIYKEPVPVRQFQLESGIEVVQEMSDAPLSHSRPHQVISRDSEGLIPHAVSRDSEGLIPQVVSQDSEGLIPVENTLHIAGPHNALNPSPERSTIEAELRQIRDEREYREIERLRRREQELVERLSGRDS